MSAIFPGLSYRQMYRKFKKNGSRSFSACNALNLFSRILSETLAYNSYFFSRTAVLRKLYDIRFSYKHCNFSRVYLLVKMASKTVTRAIANSVANTMNFRVKAHRYALLSRRINRGSPFLILETSGSHLFVMIYLIRNRVEMVPAMGIQVFSE